MHNIYSNLRKTAETSCQNDSIVFFNENLSPKKWIREFQIADTESKKQKIKDLEEDFADFEKIKLRMSEFETKSFQDQKGSGFM